jgi:hypothetical protein
MEVGKSITQSNKGSIERQVSGRSRSLGRRLYKASLRIVIREHRIFLRYENPAAMGGAIRTYLIIPREPRCCPKCVPGRSRLPASRGTCTSLYVARCTAPHSTRRTGKRGNTAGAHFGRNPMWTGRFWPLALLRLAYVALATPRSPRRARNQNCHGRSRGGL